MSKWIVVPMVFLISYLVLAAVAPPQLQLQWSQQVSAEPGAVFAHVACLDDWPSWSTWEKFDPSIQNRFSTKTCGIGAWNEWKGEQVGSGKHEILSLNPDAQVRVQSKFSDIGQSGHFVWDFISDGIRTNVVLTFSGKETSFLTRPVNLLMKSVLNEIYPNTLLELKKVVEKDLFKRLPVYEYLFDVEKAVMPSQIYILDIAHLSEVSRNEGFDYQLTGFSDLEEFIADNRITVTGPKTCLFFEKGDSTLRVAAAFPISEKVESSKLFECIELSGGAGYQAEQEVVLTPSRKEFDVYQAVAVSSFLKDHEIEFVFPIRVMIKDGLENASQAKVTVFFQTTKNE